MSKDIRRNIALVNALHERFEKTLESTVSINQSEELLNLSETNYEIIKALFLTFQSYYNLWEAGAQFEMEYIEWTMGSLIKLKFSGIN